jgi:peptide deformylase
MAKRKILTDGAPELRTVCAPVRAITPRIRMLLDDMVETMRAADGVGLAGPQVGVLRRVIVTETEPGEVYMLINPEIIESSGEQEGSEGCLSVPGQSGCVRRPERVKVRALDRDGREITVEGTGLLARCLCHEIDHLNGILYTDVALYMNDPETGEEEGAEPEPPERPVRKYRHGHGG